MSDPKVRIVLELDQRGVGTGLTTFAGQLTTLERTAATSLNRVRTSFNGLSTSQLLLAGFGVSVARIGTALGATIRPAIEFESAFAGVQKTVEGTPGQLDSIRSGLLDLSGVMPTTAAELADIAANAGQLGIQAPNILEFTEVIAQLGETTDLSFDSAAQSLARFLNITGSGAGAIGPVSDSLVALGNNTATTESQIVGFATRLASSLTIAGATEDEILALAAGFSSLGLQAEAGGSSLSRIFVSISDAAREGGSELQTYAETAGLLPEEFAEIARTNPVEAFLLFAQGLQRVNEEGGTISPILDELNLGGLRTSEAFRLAALNSEFLRNALGLSADAFDNVGARQEEYDRRVNTTAARLEILRNRLNALAINIGTPALGAVALAADLAGDAIVGLADILAPVGRELVATFGNIADAAGLLLAVFGGPALDLAGDALTGLATVASSVLQVFNLLGPAGVAVAAGLLLLATNSAAVGAGLATVAGAAALGGPALAGMAAAQVALNLAVSAFPAVAIVGALLLIGDALRDARANGEALADTFASEVRAAIEDVDYSRATAELAEMRVEQERLQAIVNDSTAFTVGGIRVREFGAAMNVLKGILPGLGSEVLDNEAALAALNARFDEFDISEYNIEIERAAALTGLSTDAVYRQAEAQGVLSDLLNGNTDQQRAAIAVLNTTTESQQALADKTGIAVERILNQTAAVGDYADALGITSTQISFLAERIDGVSLDDLLDAEKAGESFDAIESLLGSYGRLADQIGITAQTYIDQLIAADNLTNAFARMEDQVGQTAGVMETARSANQRASEASLEFASALDTVAASGDGLTELGPAFESYQLAIAQTSGTLDEFKEQQAQAALAIADAGAAAGLSGPEIASLIQAYTVPDSQITQIIGLTESLDAASQEFTALQAQALQGILVELGVIDEASPVIVAVLESLRLFATTEEEAYTAALAAADAGSLGLIADSSLEAEQFDDTEAEAELSVEAQQALDNLNAVREALLAFTSAEYLAFLLANGVPAREAVDFTRDYAANEWVTEYPAILTADESGAIEVVQLTAGEANDYAAADYGSILTSDGSPARAEMEFTRAELEAMSAAEYLAILTANGQPARTETDFTEAELRAMSAAEYLAILTGDGQPARSESATTRSDLRATADARYHAVITGDSSSAREAARQARAALDSVQSKTVTINVQTRTFNVSENGGIWNRQGVSAFADGGIGSTGVLERPGGAKIYRAATPYRIFAEPPTGDEAFIPLGAGKRAQALPVFREVGRRLGVFEDGGIATSRAPDFAGIGGRASLVQISAPVSVEISAPGGFGSTTPDEVGRIVERSVTRALNRAGRDLRNRRTR